MTERALDAAAALGRGGVDAGVLHVADDQAVRAEARRSRFAAACPRSSSAENHVSRAAGSRRLVIEALFDAGVSAACVGSACPTASSSAARCRTSRTSTASPPRADRACRPHADRGDEGMSPPRRDCRITRIDTYIVGARWCNWVFAHVFTDDGICGSRRGDLRVPAQGGRGGDQELAPPRGRSASPRSRSRSSWQEMFRNEFARGGPILNSAIARDRDRAAGTSSARRSTGRSTTCSAGALHDRLPAYANAWYGAGADRDEIAAAAAEVAARRAIAA